MPYTKRLAHYGSPKELIEYILDEKNNGEKLYIASSLNCNVETALSDFLRVQKQYKMTGNRVCYHVIQSFSPLDDITPEQANEIGKRLCEELYPDFQCVIGTHIDRGHIHNHISINAINMHGRKLEDRLANEKEGLYGLSNTSDKIAAEYGCYIMPKRTFKTVKGKDYYNQYKEQTWKEKISEDVEQILPMCSNLDDLLNEMSIRGYEIRRNKYIAVKCLGMKKFARLQTINKRYSRESLNKFFKSRRTIKIEDFDFTETEYNSNILELAKESKVAIEKSQLSAGKKEYSQYQKTKYQEVKRFYQLKQQLEFLNKYNIKSFDDIEKQISDKRSEIKEENKLLKRDKEKYNKIIEITEKAQDYIKLYKVYEYASSYKEIDPDYIMPKEVAIFLKLQDELKINSISEAKQLIKSSRQERIRINSKKNLVLNLQKELNHLDTLKEEKLSNSDLYIHNIKFGGNRIDYKNSNDKEFCINLPYTQEKIHIPKKLTAYNEKHQFYTLYLVDDKKYKLYDENNNEINEMTGTDLEEYVLSKKKEIDKLYS